MLGIKCAKSETPVGSVSSAAHDPAGGGSLPSLDSHAPALDTGGGARRSSDTRGPPPHRSGRVPTLPARARKAGLSRASRAENSGSARRRRAARRPDAARSPGRRAVRDRDGDRRVRGARQGRDVPACADHPRRGAGRPRRHRGVPVSQANAGDPRSEDPRCDRASVHGSRAARSRGGRVRDKATGPGPGVPRDQAACFGDRNLQSRLGRRGPRPATACSAHHGPPLPHGTRGLKEAMDSIRVLYVEGDPVDQELTHRHLVRHAPHIKLTVVGTVAEAVERVTIGDMDVMLADYRLPDGTGLDLLDAVKSRGLEVPVVLVTGSGDADVTVRLLKAGATDYLVKRPEYLATLPVVLESAFRWFRTASELRRAPIRLLYAEHHPEDMALTLRAFDEHDRRARVETVTRAREALARLKAAHYDVLLLDNRLPDLSGIEVLKELQAEGIRIPVVMVTGEGDEDTAVQAFKLGVVDYLIKREGYLAKLPSTIENVLAHRRLADEKDGLAVLNDLAKSLITIKDLDEVLRRG